MLKDAYKTEIGSSLLTPHKSSSFDNFINYGDNSYDFRLDNYEIAIITGKNDIEKQLPILKLPMILDGTLILDLRENVRLSVGFESIDEILITRSDYLMKFYCVKLMDKAVYNLDDYRDTYVKLSQLAFTNAINNAFLLDQDDKRILGGLISLLAVSVYDKEKPLDTRIMIAQNNTIGPALSDTDYQMLLEDHGDILTPSDLIDILKTTPMVGKRLGNIDEGKLYSVLSSMVFKSNNQYIMTGIEYPPALLSLMLLYANNTLYKKSTLAFTLKTFRKLLKIDSLTKDLDREVKEMLPFG